MFCFYARHNAWDSTEAATLFRSSIVAMVLDARRRETQPEDACNLSASAHGLRPCHPPYLGSRSSRQSTLRLRAQNPPHPIPASNDCLRTDPPLFQRDFGRTMLVARLAHEIHGRGAVADGHLNQRSVAPTTACGPKRSESTHSITLAAGGRVDSTEAAKPNITGHHHSNRTSSIQKVREESTTMPEWHMYVRHRRSRFKTLCVNVLLLRHVRSRVTCKIPYPQLMYHTQLLNSELQVSRSSTNTFNR